MAIIIQFLGFLWEPVENKIGNEGKSHQNQVHSEASHIKDDWFKYLAENDNVIKDLEKNILLNRCALHAVKDFVYDYFSDSFQYLIVKLALIRNHHAISQRINHDWKVPKILKSEFKRPKIKAEKKKEKRSGSKKSKKSKKSKSKKSSKKKGSKKSKQKKGKKKGLTKEEKAERARLKKEQERLEAERRREEENQRLLFPLKDATDDSLFKDMFGNWTKGKQDKTHKKKNKK